MFNIIKSNWSRAGLLVTAAVLTLSGAAAQPAPQRTLVLDGGTLIDGTGRAPITNAVVVVQGNRITAAGRRGQVQIPAGATVIKTDGRTILPGLIDSHTHTEDSNIPVFLHYGVTTIQDKNNDLGWLVAEREGLNNGTVKGPRLFITAQIDGSLMTEGDNNTRIAVTVEDARAHAKSAIANGVDFLNVNQDTPFDQLRAVIDVAKAANMPVLGHTQNIRIAAGMGYKYQEHMFSVASALVDPEGKAPWLTTFSDGPGGNVPEALVNDPKTYPSLIKLMVQTGVFVNPTLVGQWTPETARGKQLLAEMTKLAKDPQYAFIPAEIRAMWSKMPRPRLGYAFVAEFLKEYAAAGGKVIIGTDSGHGGLNLGGLSVHYEMQMLADMGIPNMKVLQGATLWNAQLMMKDKDLGSVEKGKLADILVIDGDPLKDISATRNIRTVIKDGQVLDTTLDPHYINPIPAPGNIFSYSPPVITKVGPVARQGGPTVTLRIEASDNIARSYPFKPNSIVRFDTVELPTKFVSGTELDATLDAKLLQRSPGLYPVYVVTPGLHGTVSAAAYEVIDTASAPITTAQVSFKSYASNASWLLGPSPRLANQGGKTVTLTIEGNNKFNPKSIARFDNTDLPTQFVNSSKLTATLDAGLLQRAPGSYTLYVLNPGPYGSVSQEGAFMVLPRNSKASWKEFPEFYTN